MKSALVCALLIADLFSEGQSVGYQRKLLRTVPARVAVCRHVYNAAQEQGADPVLLAALAYSESKFAAHAVNRRTGALGPLQVMPRLLDDELGPVRTGVLLWKRWRARRAPSLVGAVCGFKGYRSEGCDAGRRLLERVRRVRVLLERGCEG